MSACHACGQENTFALQPGRDGCLAHGGTCVLRAGHEGRHLDESETYWGRDTRLDPAECRTCGRAPFKASEKAIPLCLTCGYARESVVHTHSSVAGSHAFEAPPHANEEAIARRMFLEMNGFEAPIQDQPPPVTNTSRPIWDLVVEDMQARDHVGRERYGTPLQANNGRDALVDAYQEALDLVVYLRQVIEERGGRVEPPPSNPISAVAIAAISCVTGAQQALALSKARVDELLEHSTALRLELRATDRKRMVREFHAKFDQVIGTEPRVPDEKLARFRLALIVEEFVELLDAFVDTPREEPWRKQRLFEDLLFAVDKFPIKIDFPRFVDGLVDLGYVLEGTAVSLGVDSTPVWAEVQRVNMSKEGHECGHTKPTKPAGWVAPDIEGELRKQGFK